MPIGAIIDSNSNGGPPSHPTTTGTEQTTSSSSGQPVAAPVPVGSVAAAGHGPNNEFFGFTYNQASASKGKNNILFSTFRFSKVDSMILMVEVDS